MKTRFRRVNLFGGPSCGKSTTALKLAAELKSLRCNIEYVNEYCKPRAYEKRPIHKFDQIYLFGKQLHYEYRFLNNGVDLTITDSPVELAAIYAGQNGHHSIAQALRELSKEYNKDFLSLNIVLQRGDRKYDPNGRYQTEEQAKELDQIIGNVIERDMDNVFFVKTGDVATIINILESKPPEDKCS